jgi:glucokinase
MIGAVDIGGTKIAIGIVDENGQLIQRREIPTNASRPPKEGLDPVVKGLREAINRLQVNIEGIGIGCTGPVYPFTGMLGNIDFLPEWEGLNIVDMFEQEFGVPVALENDADAAALGEWKYGAGRGSRNFILVTIGTGIGAGLILNGNLFRGVDGSHPEIGHHVLDPSGPQCFCGARGCWESMSSGLAMENWAQSRHSTKQRSSARQLCEDAKNGDPSALEAVSHIGYYLGLGLSNLITIFAPEGIALGGGVMQSYPLFWPFIESIINSHCKLVPNHLVKIGPAELGKDAGLIGAAQIWSCRFSDGV